MLWCRSPRQRHNSVRTCAFRVERPDEGRAAHGEELNLDIGGTAESRPGKKQLSGLLLLSYSIKKFLWTVHLDEPLALNQPEAIANCAYEVTIVRDDKTSCLVPEQFVL